MTQTELNRAVAQKTGEALSTIRAFGFSLLPIACPPPLVVDWDELDQQREALLPERQRTRAGVD